MKRIISKLKCVLCGGVASLAFFIVTLNANSVCIYIAHQPKLPETAKKLRKF